MATTEPELLTTLRTLIAEAVGRETRIQRCADAIRRAGAYRWVGIYAVDDARQLVSNLAWSGPQAPAFPVFPVTRGLTSRAVASGRTVNVGDVTADADYLTALDSTRAEVIIPVHARDGIRVIGTLDVESERPHAFDAATQELLEACAAVLTLLLDPAPY
jgi:putative methionine-R-sulfoxide reductase with GAF domain